MSDTFQGPGWWIASDGKWYPPESVPAEAPASLPPMDLHPIKKPHRRISRWLAAGMVVVVLGGITALIAAGASNGGATPDANQRAYVAGIHAGRGFYGYNSGSDYGCLALASIWPGAKTVNLAKKYLNGCYAGWKIAATLATPTTTKPQTIYPPGLVRAILNDPAIGVPRNEVNISTRLDPNDLTWASFNISAAHGYQNFIQGAVGIAHLVDGTWKVVAGPGTYLVGCPAPGETSDDMVPASILAALGFGPCPK